MEALDYSALGVAGLVATTLAIGLRVVWVAYQDTLKRLAAMNETYTKLLVDLTVTLAGLKQVIEGQEQLLRERVGDARPH